MESLPTELIGYIIQYLDPISIIHLRSVSKRLRKFVTAELKYFEKLKKFEALSYPKARFRSSYTLNAVAKYFESCRKVARRNEVISLLYSTPGGRKYSKVTCDGTWEYVPVGEEPHSFPLDGTVITMQQPVRYRADKEESIYYVDLPRERYSFACVRNEEEKAWVETFPHLDRKAIVTIFITWCLYQPKGCSLAVYDHLLEKTVISLSSMFKAIGVEISPLVKSWIDPRFYVGSSHIDGGVYLSVLKLLGEYRDLRNGRSLHA
jgi:hypothetical protein